LSSHSIFVNYYKNFNFKISIRYCSHSVGSTNINKLLYCLNGRRVSETVVDAVGPNARSRHHHGHATDHRVVHGPFQTLASLDPERKEHRHQAIQAEA